jgi:hypothetical protein
VLYNLNTIGPVLFLFCVLQVRDYIHVMDLATGHSKALDKLFCTPDIGNLILHISSMSSEAAYGSSALINVCGPCSKHQVIEFVPEIPSIHMLRLLVAGCAVYNLGTGKGTSVLEMVEAFEKASGKVSKSHLALIVEKPVNAFTNVILDCVFSLLHWMIYNLCQFFPICFCVDVKICNLVRQQASTMYQNITSHVHIHIVKLQYLRG